MARSTSEIREHLRHHVVDEGGFCSELDREIRSLADEVERLTQEMDAGKARGSEYMAELITRLERVQRDNERLRAQIESHAW